MSKPPNIRFMHIRYCDENHAIQNCGGVTIAYTVVPDMGICLNIATCSFSDQFSRKIGRELAEKRLHEEGPLDVAVYEHPISETVRQWLMDYFNISIIMDHKGRYLTTFEDPPVAEIVFEAEDFFPITPNQDCTRDVTT